MQIRVSCSCLFLNWSFLEFHESQISLFFILILSKKHIWRCWKFQCYRRSCLCLILNNSLQCRLSRDWKGGGLFTCYSAKSQVYLSFWIINLQLTKNSLHRVCWARRPFYFSPALKNQEGNIIKQQLPRMQFTSLPHKMHLIVTAHIKWMSQLSLIFSS